jgi:hypothetical protein
MNSRKRKFHVLRLFQSRFHGRFRWLSNEERLWLDVAPVGREFGSKDFDRLQILDLYSHGRLSEQEAMLHLGLDKIELDAMLERDGLPSSGDVHVVSK